MNPFKRGSSRYSRSPVPETPYQRAGQVWDERMGSARVQARNWRLMAFGALLLAGGAVGMAGWQASRSAVVPWVVEVGADGAVRGVAPAAAAAEPSDPQVAWHLAQFIRDVRALPADPVVLRENWLRAYRYVTEGGARALGEHARLSDPFAAVGRRQVVVEVSNVLRASPSSFRVEWVERRFEDGAFAGEERWSALLTVRVRPPRDAEALRDNPLGVFVDALDWSRELA